jgi:hypothetical protein
VVAYARFSKDSDPLIFAYVMQAFGVRGLSCAILKFLDLLNNAIFLTALLGLMKAILTIIKGLKFVLKIQPSRFLTVAVIEHLIPKKWYVSYGSFLLWTGSIEAIISAGLIFVSAIANNVTLYALVKASCETEIEPFPVEPAPMELGNLLADLTTFLSSFDDITGPPP